MPKLLELARDATFTPAIVNEIATAGDPRSFDRSQAKELLDPDDKHSTLTDLKQYSSLDRSLDGLGHWFARRRLGLLRASRPNDPVTIDIQTRVTAAAYAGRTDLVFRTAPPPAGTRVLSPVVWSDLQRFLAWLPSVVANHHPPEVILSGGSHLSAAVALGAALPEAVGIPVTVTTTDATWRLTNRNLSLRHRLPLVGIAPRTRRIADGHGPALAVYVDVAHSEGPVDTFGAWGALNRGLFHRAIVISQRRHLDADSGPVVARAIAQRIRHEARSLDTVDVLLFVRAPWLLAVLLGMSLNTLTLRLYEWEDGTTPPSYVPSAVVRSGTGGSPIIEVAGAPAAPREE